MIIDGGAASNWSRLYKQRVERLTASGLMHPGRRRPGQRRVERTRPRGDAGRTVPADTPDSETEYPEN